MIGNEGYIKLAKSPETIRRKSNMVSIENCFCVIGTIILKFSFLNIVLRNEFKRFVKDWDIVNELFS